MKKVYKDTIAEIYNKGTYEYNLLDALLDDLDIYSRLFPDRLEIHYEDLHSVYSPERVDPCPDYFGTFAIKWENCDDNINCGLTLDELDNHMCSICIAFEQLDEMGLISHKKTNLSND